MSSLSSMLCCNNECRAFGNSRACGTCYTDLARKLKLAEARLAAEKTRGDTLAQEVLSLQTQREFHRRLCPQPHNEALFSAGTFSDLRIEADGTQFHVHAAVLAGRSPVFAAMLSTPMRESRERVLVMTDVSKEALEFFLRFVYCGSFGGAGIQSQEIALEVLRAGQKYNIPELVETLEPIVNLLPGLPEFATVKKSKLK